MSVMRKSSKNLVVALGLLLMIAISIGYAAISSNMNINGTTDIDSNKWDISFANVKETAGSVTATSAAAIQTDKTKVNFDIALGVPGNFYEFTVDVVNNGTIDAMISETVKSGISSEQAVYLNYDVTYKDGTAISKCDKLSAGETKTLKVRVEYRTDITAAQLPSEEQNLNLTFEAQYVQQKDSCTI